MGIVLGGGGVGPKLKIRRKKLSSVYQFFLIPLKFYEKGFSPTYFSPPPPPSQKKLNNKSVSSFLSNFIKDIFVFAPHRSLFIIQPLSPFSCSLVLYGIGYFLEVPRKVAYFPEDFQEIVTYFPEEGTIEAA